MTQTQEPPKLKQSKSIREILNDDPISEDDISEDAEFGQYYLPDLQNSAKENLKGMI